MQSIACGFYSETFWATKTGKYLSNRYITKIYLESKTWIIQILSEAAKIHIFEKRINICLVRDTASDWLDNR